MLLLVVAAGVVGVVVLEEEEEEGGTTPKSVRALLHLREEEGWEGLIVGWRVARRKVEGRRGDVGGMGGG